jgi:uncharacterized protein (DUF2236 family)
VAGPSAAKVPITTVPPARTMDRYRMYGMSMRPVPKSWEDFKQYWDRVCREELEINRATLDIFQIRIPKPKFAR